MNRKKQQKLNSLNYQRKKSGVNSKRDEVILNIEFIENLSLFKFRQLINSASSKDVEKALYSIIKIIRDEKEKPIQEEEDQEEQEEELLNYKNKNISIIFEYLKQSPQLTEIFTIWDTCIDKYQVYQTCYSLLLEFIAIIITINDDPALQYQTRVLADKIISNRFLDIQKIINSYSDETVNLTLNCYRLLSSMVPLSIKIAKTLQTNIDFNSSGFQQAMTDISSNGAYLGTRPYVLRFLLSFLKHHNLKLTEFVLESDHLLPRYCQKLQLDHHNVILDLIESLEANILKVDIIPKKLKIKFFSPSFLSKIGLVFSRDDIGEENRQSIYKFLTTLCCSPSNGICSSDPKWTWFRDSDLPCYENKSIVSLITELNPIAYQTHQSLFIKIINACPDLFTSYLKKLGSSEVALSLNWLNRTTMLIKTLSSPVPKAPTLKITSKLSESIPSSPMVLINLLVPPQVTNLTFGFDISNLVTYNQLLVLQLCLKRVNSVLGSLNSFLIEKQQQQQQKEDEVELLIGFIENLKNGIKERLPQFRYFKEHYSEFKSCDTIYNQYISIISEYVRFLPINDFLTLKMLDYSLIVKSDLYTQKQFTQLIGFSKSFNTTQNLFNKETLASVGGQQQSIINMVLKLFINSKPEIKDLYHQLLFKLISVNNIFSSVDGEIDYWLDFITSDNIEFFETTLLNAHQNKFHYVNLIQNLTKKLFGSNSNQLFISPVLVSALLQLFTGLQESQFNYLSQVITNISSLSKNNSLLILSIINFIKIQQQSEEIKLELTESNILGSLESNNPFKFNLPSNFNSAIKFIYYQSFNKEISNSTQDQDKELTNLILNCSSPKEIKFIVSNYINNPILLIIQEKDLTETSRFIQSIKFVPSNLLLSQFNLIKDNNKKQSLISNQLIRSNLISSISNLSIRKLINILPIMENLINNQFNCINSSKNSGNNQVDSVFDFYFDIVELVFKLILESKSLNGIRSIEQFLSNNLIDSNYLINFKLTFNVSKLILIIFNNINGNNRSNSSLLNNILSPFTNKIFNQINKKSIKDSKKSNDQFILSIRVLELILPYLDFNSLIQLLKEFKELDIKSLSSNEPILQIYLEILNSLLRLTSSGTNNNILPKYLPTFNFNDNSNNITSNNSNNNISNSGNNELLKSIFIQLIELSLSLNNSSSLIYKITIDQFVYQFLLIDLNQINLSINNLNSLLYSRKELISKYLDYCLENCSPITSQIIIIVLLANSFTNEGNSCSIKLDLLDFDRLLKFDVTIWLPLVYWLVIKENQQEIISNESLLVQIYQSISTSNIFERDINSSLISVTLELFKFISCKLQSNNSKLITNSKLNYLLLFNKEKAVDEYDNPTLKSMISNYSNNLLVCVKNSFKDLLNLNIENIENIQSNYLSFENIIKSVFSLNVNLSQNLEIIERIVFGMESSLKYQLYIDLIFKSILNSDSILNIIKNNSNDENISDSNNIIQEEGEEQEEESLSKKLLKSKNNINNNENLLRYRILNILLKIYYKEPSYCNSNQNSKLTSIYFSIYNATVHPIDQLLLKIIYQHETNGYSILSESNYLWGKHSKESSSITQLLLSNTIFSGGIFENSINNFPYTVNTLYENGNQNQQQKYNSDNEDNDNSDLMQIDSDSESEKEESESSESSKLALKEDKVNDEIIIKSYQEFSYDPSFILRLLTSLLDSFISEYSNLENQQEDFRKENIENLWRLLQCFFYNGPFSFTVRSLSSKDLSIRQLSYQILSKYQTVLDIYQEQNNLILEQSNNLVSSKSKSSKKSSNNNSNKNNSKSNFNNEKIIIKLIQVLKSSIFEKDQYIPPIFTLFYCLSLKSISSKSDLKRKSIISYFKGITLLDYTHIPMFSLVLNFTLNKATIIWILEMISIALPDQHTEMLLKKSNSISSLLGLFDSNVSNSRIKSLILEIILKLSNSSTGGLYLIIKQGVLPWLALLISNSSCPKLLFDNVFLILTNIIKNINSSSNYYNFNELSQLSIILNNLLKLLLNINWDIEFKFIIINYFKSLNLIINSSSNSIRLSTFDMVSLIKCFNSTCSKREFFESEIEKLELQDSIMSIISYSKLSSVSTLSNENLFVFNWVFNLLNQINISNDNNNLLNSILKWIQDSLLNSRKQFIQLLNNNHSSSKLLLNQLFFIINQIDITLLEQQSNVELSLLQIKKLICNILILLLSESSNTKSILSKNYNQDQLLNLVQEIPSPNNQKSDETYKEIVNNILLYIKNSFFN